MHKKKCGAHTHVHHLSQLFSRQYSRRLLSILAQLQAELTQLKQELLLVLLLFTLVVLVHQYIYFLHIVFTTCTVVQHENKKNAEHTRMYTNFRNFSSQYSRRLLSILAQPQLNPTFKTILVICL